MIHLNFEIPCRAIPQQRARKGKDRTGKAVWYDPKGSADYKEFVAWCARKAYRDAPLTGKIDMTIIAYFQRPKTATGRHPVSRTHGDWDNLGKAVSDALNGIIYLDDSQVCTALVSKVYTTEHERISITIYGEEV